jgi:flagellar motor switch protein FliG
MTTSTLTKTQKVATVLASLGVERAAAVLEHLSPPSAHAIATELSRLDTVPAEMQRAVLREFRALVSREEPAGPTPLHELPAAVLAELLADEPPHLAALLLRGFAPTLATAVLAALPPALQPPVAQALATLETPAPEARALLESAVRAKAARRRRQAQVEGRALLATLAPSAPPPAPDSLTLARLASLDPALMTPALLTLDLDTVDTALRGVDAPVRQAVLAALPFRRRMAITTRLKTPRPVILRDILAAQRLLVRAVAQALAAREEAAHV